VLLFLYQPSLSHMLTDRATVFVFCMCTASLSVVYILSVHGGALELGSLGMGDVQGRLLHINDGANAPWKK